MTFAADRVVVRAPGKLNLAFRVGDEQPDGYHDVASVYQAVSLFEDVIATPADDIAVTVTGAVDVGAVPTDDTNLAVRAARLLAEETGVRLGAHLRIHKQVPVAGGMGGGSADAAAALVACDALWGTALPPAALRALGARLGADVPFALLGGTAVGTGRGDQLSPALARGRFDWVLLTSPDGLSTPTVYGELDRLRAAAQYDIAPPRGPVDVDPDVLHALRAGDAAALAAVARNDLQAAALSLRPDLASALEAGRAAGALTGIVSGSGPTLAFLAADDAAAAQIASEFTGAARMVHHVHGPVAGTKVVSIS